MGTGYTRNDTANNIADGNIINAADFDGEYDAIEAAFNASTGHTHDGTSAEGAPIEVVGPSQDVVITASAIRPKTTNTVDLGTSSLEFKDAYFDGTVTADSVNITSGLTIDTINLTSTDAGAAKGPQLDIFRDSASPADSDVLGHIDFSGKDSGDNKTIYASILAEAADVTDTTEDGVLKFNTMVAGSDTTIVTVNADGVDVTGTVTADGLTVDGDAVISSANARLRLKETDTTNNDTQLQTTGGVFKISRLDDDNSTATPRFAIDNSTGDISFYEDTGTTAKLFWDASAESLGIGTSSPQVKMQVNDSGTSPPSTGYGTGLNIARSDGLVGLTVGYNSANLGSYLQAKNFTNSDMKPLLLNPNGGNVGIGTSSPSSYNSAGDNLVIAETSGGAGLTLASSTTGSGHILFADGTTGTGAYDGFIRFDHTTSSMRFASGGGSERMRIDSSGNVGVGTSSPSEKLHVSTVGSSGVQTAARFSSSTDVSGCKIERDGSAWRLASQGALHLGADYDANGTAATSLIVFEIDGTEKMRIDSSGNLLVGTTDTTVYDNNSNTTADNGLNLRGDGKLDAARYNGIVLGLNLTGNDGTIVDLRKSGTTVGSIGAKSGDIYIGTGDTGVRFNDGDNAIYAANTSPYSASDGNISLGVSAARFKDLYLSGGAYIGGTGSANYLDDYEEGTFTPTMNGTNVTGSGAVYVKIGQFVHFNMDITAPSGISSTSIISGLPFTVTSGYHSAFTVGYTDTANAVEGGYINNGSTNIRCTTAGGTGAASVAAGERLILAGTYRTNA